MPGDIVIDFYTKDIAHEWKRLVQDAYHRLEFETTLHYLRKYLPASGTILDAGGGPGRYTVTLARQGYQMVLMDLTPANLEFAERKIRDLRLKRKVKQLVEGSLVDMSFFPDNSFDAVICLGGPLSHILDPIDRQTAAAELVRVARPGAPIFVSVIARLALLITELVYFPHEIELPHFSQIRDNGNYEGGYGFTACHFFLPEEIPALFKGLPITQSELIGLEGLSSNQRTALNRLARQPVRWEKWIETHYLTCSHPAVVGMSEHMLYIGQKCP